MVNQLVSEFVPILLWLSHLPEYVQVIMSIALILVLFLYVLGKTGLGKEIIDYLDTHRKHEWEMQSQERDRQERSRHQIDNLVHDFDDFRGYYQREHEKLQDLVTQNQEMLLSLTDLTREYRNDYERRLKDLKQSIETLSLRSDEEDRKLRQELSLLQESMVSLDLILLRDRITHYCSTAIRRGYRTLTGTEMCTLSYNKYHDLGGNTYVHELYNQYMKLPVYGDTIETPMYPHELRKDVKSCVAGSRVEDHSGD